MGKTTKLSVRLLKEQIEAPEDALKDNQTKLTQIDLTGNPDDKKLWAGQVYGGNPNWFSFFNAEEQEKLEEEKIFGAGGGAVLFVRVDDTSYQQARAESNDNEPHEPRYRWMAVCFGMGFQALEPDLIEPNFGTIVALNKIGEDLIRSIDTKRPEDSTIQTRIQNSKKGKIFDFGIDQGRIILHSITGETDDKDFATTVTGSEGLTINSEVSYNTAAEKCQAIYDAYLLKDYQTRAPWYGKILPVKDAVKIDTLNNKLLAELTRDEGDKSAHLAPPDIVDYQDIGKFRYTGQELKRNTGQEGFDELNLDDFISRLKTPNIVTLEILKKSDVQVSAGENDVFRKKWSVYKCITAEISLDEDQSLYVISNGEWYQIKKQFVTDINNFMDSIEESSLSLIPFKDSEHTETKKGKVCLSEGVYNIAAEEAHDDLTRCDKKNIHFKNENGPVEFCDLFSTNKDIIHVKMRGASANLSHHFMQGYVSAQAFKNSNEFRKKIIDKMPAITSHVNLRAINTNDYKIVFAFIQDNQRYLPFFSKVAFRAVHQMLVDMNYKVNILWIDRERKSVTEELENEDEQAA